MKKAWVVVGSLIVGVAAFAQTEVSIPGGNSFNTAQVSCDSIGADLDITIGNPLDRSKPSLRVFLRNYRTVAENSSATPLKFKLDLDDATVGSIVLNLVSTAKSQQWRIYRDVTPTSQCTAQLREEAPGEIAFDLKCVDLVRAEKSLTYEERKQQVLASVSVASSCRLAAPKP